MRLVQVMVPAGKRESVLSTLDEEGIDYVLSDETSGREYTAVVSFPLPTEAVEPMLQQLRDVGLERDAYTVVLNAETVISRRFEDLEKRYEEEDENGDRIAREELAARADEMAPELSTFVVMTAISAIVATAGLLLDSPAVVVGSMVIAPLVGPAMATSVGTVIDDADLFRQGVRLQVLGAVLAIASAALFAAVMRFANVVPPGTEVFTIGEVRERLAPDVLSLPIALGAGVAGALSISSGVSTALVGVMIAAALVPPTAVVGIGLAWGEPMTVSGSFLLVVVNFVSINFTALAVLWYKGYRPDRLFQLGDARSATVKHIAVLGVIILLSTTFLVGVTFASYQSATFEESATQEAAALVGDDGTVLDVEVAYGGYPFRQPTAVTVTVGHPRGEEPPELAQPLAASLADDAEAPFGIGGSANVTVRVRYIAAESATTGQETTGSTAGDVTAHAA
ncbi:TIGR00341 family protein [Halorarum halophilum]|uniref:TIGR00341 family protein n=1 Tax=Halorarum halophilum TaxID=2743090 RepID=A0A7D5KE74_9EURY|nr:TIGR00341 family protein [Halobaculum halophilum]QLG28037.1 TIGR00341 family protein [Halobaculum halophilum]